MPGLEWFKVLDESKDIVTIGTVLSKTRDTPLDIEKYFKTNPKAILLETANVPFEIIINSDKLQGIVSMLPYDVDINIREISSSTLSINQILDVLMPTSAGDIRRKIYVRTIKGRAIKGFVFILDNQATLNNVVISSREATTVTTGSGMKITTPAAMVATYESEGKIYTKSYGAASLATPEELKIYQADLPLVGKYPISPEKDLTTLRFGLEKKQATMQGKYLTELLKDFEQDVAGLYISVKTLM